MCKFNLRCMFAYMTFWAVGCFAISHPTDLVFELFRIGIGIAGCVLIVLASIGIEATFRSAVAAVVAVFLFDWACSSGGFPWTRLSDVVWTMCFPDLDRGSSLHYRYVNMEATIRLFMSAHAGLLVGMAVACFGPRSHQKLGV